MRKTSTAWLNGMLGVIIFSGSLPATRVAVAGFDPYFLTSARAGIAGLLGLALLVFMRARRPHLTDLKALVFIAIGVVLGFPLFTAMALQYITAARSLVFLGLLPLATAIFGVVRGGERPRLAFWVFAVLGALCVASFALLQGGGASLKGDSLMLLAIVLCGYGYAEGGRLSRQLGGWQVISWALVLSLPISMPMFLILMPGDWQNIGLPAWLGLGYVTLFSMLLGFFFWYRGLALGGIAAVGQLQLLQPFLGLMLAAALLNETISWPMLVATSAVIACVAGARRFSAAPPATKSLP
ncbi:DMT family transporter [Allopusillimonas ginsengisoli]|uniref:DMT family transporter n=1 Tax=Allopusillimonas ginsengisoli TaxID=453575 RepID=UPI0010C235E2|nr:DMT family transporter [Allopusillimonas ginsengisoli]